MKNGTEYARRVKKLFKQLRSAADKVPDSEPTDPVEHLVRGLLVWKSSRAGADKALALLYEKMVDLNEVRVSSVREIANVIRDCVADSVECAEAISAALNDVYRREYTVSLQTLQNKGRREARQYLESLEGVNEHAVAWVMLWGLGGHAIPANESLISLMRSEDLVDPDATPGQIQAFLERNISAADAKAFCVAMESLASGKGGGLPANGKSTAKKRSGKSTTKKTRKKRASASTGTRKKKTAKRQ